jgi:methylglyoxal synthase
VTLRQTTNSVPRALLKKLVEEHLGLSVRKFESGPLGGDQQIAEGEIDSLIFFCDPLAPHPHDPDVKALSRIAVVWNIPFACNHASADFMITSPLMSNEYQGQLPEFDSYRQRLKT